MVIFILLNKTKVSKIFYICRREIIDLQTAKINVMQKIMNVSKASLFDKISNILDEEMENAVKMRVRLVADVHMGKTWYDAKG